MSETPTTVETSRSTIDKTWTMIDESFDKALAKCTTGTQRVDLRALHNNARTAWWAARSKDFDENDVKVQETRESLIKANKDVMEAKKNLDDIVAFLKFAAAAVNLAASLAGVVLV